MAGQIGLDAELFGAPVTEAFEERDQGLAGGAERIGDLRRGGRHCCPVDDAILFQFAELGGENFFADASEKIAQFGEAQWTKRKAPHRLDFPLAAEDVDGGLNGTAMVRFHVGTPGLQICAYFAAAQCRYTMSRKRWARAVSPNVAGRHEPQKESRGKNNDSHHWSKRECWQSGFARGGSEGS